MGDHGCQGAAQHIDRLGSGRWKQFGVFWATDAKSVFDQLTKVGTGKSKDRRMAIEGALLREALRSPNA
eukprot:9174592-Prorocentrum_lima.AAC.1